MRGDSPKQTFFTCGRLPGRGATRACYHPGKSLVLSGGALQTVPQGGQLAEIGPCVHSLCCRLFYFRSSEILQTGRLRWPLASADGWACGSHQTRVYVNTLHCGSRAHEVKAIIEGWFEAKATNWWTKVKCLRVVRTLVTLKKEGSRDGISWSRNTID